MFLIQYFLFYCDIKLFNFDYFLIKFKLQFYISLCNQIVNFLVLKIFDEEMTTKILHFATP